MAQIPGSDQEVLIMENQLKIWIELDKPASKQDAEINAILASKMLHKLGCSRAYSFFWDDKAKQYCYGGAMGYETLLDNGKWFDLNKLSA